MRCCILFYADFVTTYYRGQVFGLRPKYISFLLLAIFVYDNNTVHMVWHYYKLIRHSKWKVFWNFEPASFCSQTNTGQHHLAVNNVAEIALLILCADSHVVISL